MYFWSADQHKIRLAEIDDDVGWALECMLHGIVNAATGDVKDVNTDEVCAKLVHLDMQLCD